MEELNLPNKVIYEVINNLINEQDDEDEKITFNHDGEKHTVTKKTARQYASDINQGDDSEYKSAAVKAANLDSKDTKKDKEDDDSGKLSGDDFDTEKYMGVKSDKDTDDKPKAQSNGYTGDKDKTLEQGNPNDSEEYNRDLEPDDDGFNERNKKDANPTPPPPLKLDGIVKNPKFPKRYLKVLERMVNSKISTRTAKWSHFSDIEGGAGKISAQAGELMTMMGTSMSDEEFEELTNAMLEHEKQLLENHPEVFKKKNKQGKLIDNPGSRIVDKSWVKAAKQSRKAILDRVKDQYGEGTEIVATAWDVENEVETMGLSDYKNNKGFSTDMYIKVKKPDGEEVLDEVSLKKSTKVNFLNSSAGKFEEWDDNLPENINQTVYRNKARKRNIDFINNNRQKVDELLNSPEGEPIRKLMKSKGLTIEQALEGGSRDRQNVLWKTIGLLAKKGDESAKSIIEQDNKEHNEFVAESVKAITENPKMKAGMLSEIRSEFPLKAVSDGEETMAIGPNSLDKKTMKAIFGTDNYDEIKENLVAEPGPPPFIGYNVAASGEVFPVAEIKVREDGRGYGGQFKFEMLLHKDFAPRLEKAQSDVYGETE
tara:strand:- start:72 stop:1859 length:1788 start_codon:yes stop_codon:yes gene_type:complete